MLVQQERYDMAVQELRQVLTHEPEDARAHALMAVCLSEQKEYERASAAADQAIGLAPDESYCHFAQSVVMAKRNRFTEAEEAIRTAIELDTGNTSLYGHLAGVLFAQRRWKECLEAAETGLALDPEDVECTNMRALALVKLGQSIDAGDALATALKRNPEDAYSHANLGWSLLEQGKAEKAMEHFREALRLNPELQYARAGMVEAMKARYFLYGLMLNWFLWMMKLTSRAQWGVIMGAYVVFVIVNRMSATYPILKPLVYAYIAFAILTWVASPLFNLLLRLNKFGRLALSPEETVTSNWVGLCMLGGLCMLAAYFVTWNFMFVLAAAVCLLMIPPIAHIYTCDEGWPRTVMVMITIGLMLVGTASLALGFGAPYLAIEQARTAMEISSRLFLGFAIGALLSQFAVNALVNVKPRR